MEFFTSSRFFGVFITLAAFEIGNLLKNKFKNPLFNPILISVVLICAFLLVTGIDYSVYERGAKYISYFLTPVTVCLAVPLYRQLSMLKSNMAAILAGIFSGVIASCLGILALAVIFNLDSRQYATLLPKSITTAIGVGVADELGGMSIITVPVIVLSGIFGNMTCTAVTKLFGITHPVAKGVAIGTASHAIGTSKAMEMGQVEGAMSGLSIAMAGLMTVAAAQLFILFR